MVCYNEVGIVILDIREGLFGLNVICLMVVLLNFIYSWECFLINVCELIIFNVSSVLFILVIELRGIGILMEVDFFCKCMVFLLLKKLVNWYVLVCVVRVKGMYKYMMNIRYFFIIDFFLLV